MPANIFVLCRFNPLSMAGVIYCGFARVAVYVISQRHSLPNGTKSPSWREGVIEEYKSMFQGYPKMQFQNNSNKYIAEKIADLRACFCRRWNPSQNKVEYIKTFSFECWQTLSVQSKQMHSLNACQACDLRYSITMATFPVRSNRIK